MASVIERFEVTEQMAEAYEQAFVPRLFGPWARDLVDRAGPRAGDQVLDVGSGTGAVAREVAARIGAEGVTGVDLNEGMLAVARRVAPEIDWRRGDACRLPFEDARFDRVLSQAVLMFVPDVDRALAEMTRVTRPGGTVSVQVWASLEAQPVYGPFVEVAARHAGVEALTLLGAYWSQGDRPRLEARLSAAGLEVMERVTVTKPARFGSVAELVATEVDGTPLGARLTPAQRDAIVADSERELAAWVDAAGVEVPLVAHIVTARRPS